MKLKVKDRIDLYTESGEYLFSVCKGGDGQFRRVFMYKGPDGQERIGRIEMSQPDFVNQLRMNI